MALAIWLTSYHREAPDDHIKCKWPISTAVISRGVLGIVDRSQLNRAFGKASGILPPSVRDAAGYTLKKIYVAGDPSPWNFLQFKDCVVDARDMADLLRCIDWTIAGEEDEEGGDGLPFDLLCRFVHTPDDCGAVRNIAGALFDNIAKQPSAALALLLSKKEVDNVAVSSFGRPGQRMTTDAMALLRTALVAVVAAGAAFLPPPLEEIAPHLADADEEPAVARQRGPSGLFMKVAGDEETRARARGRSGR